MIWLFMSPSLCKNLVEIGPVVSEIFDQMCSAVAVGVDLVQITANSMELFFCKSKYEKGFLWKQE